MSCMNRQAPSVACRPHNGNQCSLLFSFFVLQETVLFSQMGPWAGQETRSRSASKLLIPWRSGDPPHGSSLQTAEAWRSTITAPPTLTVRTSPNRVQPSTCREGAWLLSPATHTCELLTRLKSTKNIYILITREHLVSVCHVFCSETARGSYGVSCELTVESDRVQYLGLSRSCVSFW